MIDGHNDALEAIRHAGKRLDRLNQVDKQLEESERRRVLAEDELAALGTEVMYCVDCATPFRYIPGVHQIEYCFTCLGRRSLDVGHLEEEIAELHREIEFIDSPVVVSLIGARKTIATTARGFALREFGWLLILMATAQRNLIEEDERLRLAHHWINARDCKRHSVAGCIDDDLPQKEWCAECISHHVLDGGSFPNGKDFPEYPNGYKPLTSMPKNKE